MYGAYWLLDKPKNQPMKLNRIPRAALQLGLLTIFLGAPALAQEERKLSAEEARRIGVEAVIYGLPLMMMHLTERVSTNLPAPESNAHAPVNQFGNALKYPSATDQTVVRLNVDTLYSSAWLDLSKEPMVLSVPDTKGRYYMMPMLDAWTNVFASPGTRTTGNKAGNFAITGPGWNGALPKGVQQIQAPTNTVWIIGRTQTNGPADYAAVNALQEEYKLTPLSAFGKSYTPPPGIVDPAVDMKRGPVDQVAAMDAPTFFKTLARLMACDPAPAADAPALAMLAKIGVVPGQDFDAGKLDPAVAQALQKPVQIALEKLQAAAKTAGKSVNGWNVPPGTVGKYGTNYGFRAVISLIGLGANLPADAIYPNAFFDGDGNPLAGDHRYVVHFDKGETPPANAFWSITMYNARSSLVENPSNRYRHRRLDAAEIQPGRVARCLHSKGLTGPGQGGELVACGCRNLSITMRVYWPKPEMLDGSSMHRL